MRAGKVLVWVREEELNEGDEDEDEDEDSAVCIVMYRGGYKNMNYILDLDFIF